MTVPRILPHHAEELRASGLSDETIFRAALRSVTNEEATALVGFGRSGALAFPYRHTAKDGDQPFTRVKFDKPDVKGKRYAQAKGSGNRLYIPPTLDPAVLQDSGVPLCITEGEKKCLKAVQEGLPCVSVSGVDSWRSRVNGKSQPIGDLDLIAWKGRRVSLVYDSDLATNERVRWAEYDLARELARRGATVGAIRLPGGPNGEKVGLDDYLCAHSVETFCEIEPVPVVHPQTAPLPTGQPKVAREGDDFTYTWPTLGVEVRVTRLREAAGGIDGELSVALNGRALHWGRANLASTSAREGLVTKLNRVHAKIPWREILEEVCRETAEKLRAGAPTVQLVPAGRGVERHLVDKVILDGETNVLFGDGGAGKSFLALALAVAAATGKPLPAGLTPRRSGPVLYLDWESTEEEQQERLGGLLAGLAIPGPVPVFYRRMVGALADEAPKLRSEVARLGAVLIITDSLGPASGPEPEGADAAIRTLNALRALGPARLVLAHVSKLHADHKGPARPFGSVYVMNLPRNVWEVRKADEEQEDVLTLGAYHRKTNRGRLLPPFSLRFEFAENAIRVRPADIAEDAGLRTRAGLGYSILALLRSGARTIEGLAEETEASEEYVRKVLSRLEKAGKVVRVGEQRPAPGRPVEWGLKA